jgi:hypothetical protein
MGAFLGIRIRCKGNASNPVLTFFWLHRITGFQDRQDTANCINLAVKIHLIK